ncbi:MAG: hypothetical protein K2K80_05670 [Clostridia bacterium]|nr:hypothetical protein [Clostridia bacterium]
MNHNNEISELDRVVAEYKETFDVDDAPRFLMMESTEDYIGELKGAIERGKPLTDDDRIDCDIIE